MKLLPLVGSAALVLGADQLTKTWILHRLPFGEIVPVTSFFSLTHIGNTGAAFGLFQGGNTGLIFLTIAVLFFLTWSFHQRRASRAETAGLALVWGGGLGNLADRIFRGQVVDFLDFHWRNWHWPAFNVADSAICVGIFLFTLFGMKTPASDPAERAPLSS